MDNAQAMNALVNAQVMVDEFARVANIRCATLMPPNLPQWEVGLWQESETNPQNNPEWLAAITERDRCLEPFGWSLDEWLQKWEHAKRA